MGMVNLETSISPQELQAWENTHISFIYDYFWKQKWREENLPPHIFRSFLSNAEKLSDLFTVNRKKIDTSYFNRKEAHSAYLIYFQIPNIVRIARVLEEIKQFYPHFSAPSKAKKSVLELGTGMGAGLWALAHTLGDELGQVTISDQNKNVLQCAARLWEFQNTLGKNVALKRQIIDFADRRTPQTLKKNGSYDVVLMSNMLNEFIDKTPAQLGKLFQPLIRESMHDDSLLILIEPALQRTSRMLTLLRDELNATYGLKSILPCFHDSPCLMNREKFDWCHSDITWKAPKIRKRIDKALEHQSDRLKLSYLVFTKGKHFPFKSSHYRMISDPLKIENNRACLLCRASGKQKLDFSKKEKAFTRECFRGQVLNRIPDFKLPLSR